MMTITVEDILAHHGIKGMHWGVRRPPASTSEHLAEHEFEAHHDPGTAKIRGVTVSKTARPSDDAIRSAATKALIKQHGTDAISNGDLNHLVNRLDLENRYKEHSTKGGSGKIKKEGQQFVKELVKDEGKKAVKKGIAVQVSKQALRKAAYVTPALF
jgi:hypothetical protein